MIKPGKTISKSVSLALQGENVPLHTKIDEELKKAGYMIQPILGKYKPPGSPSEAAIQINIKNNMVRILQRIDPIDFITRIILGEPVPTYVVHKDKDGNPSVEVVWENASLKQRIQLAESLRKSMMPQVSLVRRVSAEEEEEPNKDEPLTLDNFAEMVAKAANKSKDGTTIGRKAAEKMKLIPMDVEDMKVIDDESVS